MNGSDEFNWLIYCNEMHEIKFVFNGRTSWTAKVFAVPASASNFEQNWTFHAFDTLYGRFNFFFCLSDDSLKMEINQSINK